MKPLGLHRYLLHSRGDVSLLRIEQYAEKSIVIIWVGMGQEFQILNTGDEGPSWGESAAQSLLDIPQAALPILEKRVSGVINNCLWRDIPGGGVSQRV